jgi:hypothetical protein
MKGSALATILSLLAAAAFASASPPEAQRQEDSDAELATALAGEGLVLDRAAGWLALPAAVQIKNDLLEYLLVAPQGAAHESLLLTKVRPSLLNAALLLLGVEPGRNARFEPREGFDDRGRPNRAVVPPEGDGFFLYAAWREGEETYFFRVEDLVRNLASGRSLRRHRWVYLGSRFAPLKPGGAESFLADVSGDLINLSFFFEGNTLLTAAPPECLEQTIWAANEWLLPPQGEPVQLIFARAPLETLPPGLAATLPVARTGADAAGGGDER